MIDRAKIRNACLEKHRIINDAGMSWDVWVGRLSATIKTNRSAVIEDYCGRSPSAYAEAMVNYFAFTVEEREEAMKNLLSSFKTSAKEHANATRNDANNSGNYAVGR